MKHGNGTKVRDDKSNGIEILMTETSSYFLFIING
jgi:hypothetical protein